jgi:hypothetical protein
MKGALRGTAGVPPAPDAPAKEADGTSAVPGLPVILFLIFSVIPFAAPLFSEA